MADPGPGPGPGLKHTSLRYFNVVGSGSPELYDTSPHNLFPIVLRALTAGKTPRINGIDYNTAGRTCVRDYVHVADLATSHVAAAQALAAGKPLERVYNLGSGDGLSVRQIMTAMATVTGIDFDRRSVPAGRGIRTGSWPTAPWPPATWTGRCGTPWRTWSPAPTKRRRKLPPPDTRAPRGHAQC